MAKKSNTNMSFEEAMEKLENSVLNLESSSLSLDDSIGEFEEAVKLIKFCEDKLSSSKQKVRILTESNDGSITDAPFDGDNIDAP